MKIGTSIRKIRELKGLKQEYLATKLDLSVNSYGKLERDEVEITLKRTEEIAAILEIEISALILFDESKIFKNSYRDNVVGQSNQLVEHLQQTINSLNSDKHRLLCLLELALRPNHNNDASNEQLF